MESVNLDKFREILIAHEGWRNFPYEDTVGVTTIGVGRNLESNGLSNDEVEYLLQNDIKRVLGECESFSYWDALSDRRKLVVASLVFQLGIRRFRGFVKTNAALEAQDYSLAAREMLDSKWARQVPRRARELSDWMMEG